LEGIGKGSEKDREGSKNGSGRDQKGLGKDGKGSGKEILKFPKISEIFVLIFVQGFGSYVMCVSVFRSGFRVS
jgi:hypothetical protein